MAYKLYKMTFQSVHFGNGSLDLSSEVFSADRLFSALVLEAVKAGKLEAFMALSQTDDFVLSDAFPYSFAPFLPKPIGYPAFDKIKQEGDVIALRKAAKKSKKLQYIDYTMMGDFLDGETIDEEIFTAHDYVTKNQPNKSGALYQVGTIRFKDEACLYVIAFQSPLLDQLMESLQYSGLGGKRTSGYGRFDLEILEVPEDLLLRLTCESSEPVMSLTAALPIDEDLPAAMENGKYLLKKSSGFAFSDVHAENLRKQDLYKFKAGSAFKQSFKGQIVDVRPDGFPHPVWNYAKPLFYRLEI